MRLSYYSEGLHPENIRPPLDIGFSISLLNGNNDVNIEFIDTKLKEYSDEDLVKFADVKDIDIVFIKCQTPVVERAKDISKEFKNKTKVQNVILFGQHPTISPETFLYDNSYVDFCIKGEPETVIPELVNKIDKLDDMDKIDGVCYYDDSTGEIVDNGFNKIDDFKSLPQPDHSHFLNKGYSDVLPMRTNFRKKYGYVITSRGCPFNCVYCSPTLRVTYGKDMRYRDPIEIVDEIEDLYEQGVNVVVFKDDLFTFSEDHVISICKEIIDRDIDISWFAQTRSDCLNEKMLYYMRKSGCKTLGIGVESGSEEILKRLDKDETKDDARKAFDLAKKYDIEVVGYFLLNNPGETKEDALKTIKFCDELDPDMIQVAFLTPYPGSPVYEEICKNDDIEYEKFLHYNDLPYNCSDISDEQLFELQNFFYKRFYLSFGFMKKFILRSIRTLPFSIFENFRIVKMGLKFLYKKI